jgi:molybdopterin synthase sulfur carrier subunit
MKSKPGRPDTPFRKQNPESTIIKIMTNVRIPTPLRKLTREKEIVEASGSNVAEIIEDLERNYPGLKERVCDEEGNIRRFVNVFLNDEDIRFLEDKSTSIKDGDELSIVPAIAGG